MGALNKLKERGQGALHVQNARGDQKAKTKSEKCFMLLSATFQFTTVNFKQPYLIGFLLNLSETDPDIMPQKSTFKWLKLEAIWGNRLGDMGKTCS